MKAMEKKRWSKEEDWTVKKKLKGLMMKAKEVVQTLKRKKGKKLLTPFNKQRKLYFPQWNITLS